MHAGVDASSRSRAPGSLGAGLYTLPDRDDGERVLEVARLRRERRSGGKTPTRSTRSVPPAACSPRSEPRHRGRRRTPGITGTGRCTGRCGQREACQGLCQLRDLLITTPEPLRRGVAATAHEHGSCSASPATRPQRADVIQSCAAACSRFPLDRATGAATDRRGARTRTRDRNVDTQAGATATRPTRRRSTHAAARLRALLVSPGTHQL